MGSAVSALLGPPSPSSGLIRRIRKSIIGDDHLISGPYGERALVYADYTASGRALSFIEDYINQVVLPLYANTHTITSGTGLQTTQLREDARKAIRDCVGGSAEDIVIFKGSGATGAIAGMMCILGLRIPAGLDEKYHLQEIVPKEERPVIFIGPYEHHSNEIMWRESIADVVVIHEDHENGGIDLDDLEKKLVEFEDRPLRIGSFSAASNVTGILSNTHDVTRILHEHGALSFWDYAAAGPYVDIEMTNVDDPILSKDAVFISPHKFIGGPATPGVLIVKKKIVINRVPSVPGGGTVQFVSPDEHVYLEDPEHKEEGGTPNIVGSIRAGLVFRLKKDVGVEYIHEREESYLNRAHEVFDNEPNIMVLGNPKSPRLAIVSIIVKYEHDRSLNLHHDFVVALLNDVFGIQARGGCSCAGPLGHRLLGIDKEKSAQMERVILKGYEGIKMGWSRINFNYFISDAVFEYIVKAVVMIARDGWALLPDYVFEEKNGKWKSKRGSYDVSRFDDFSFAGGEIKMPKMKKFEGDVDELLDKHIRDAELIFKRAKRRMWTEEEISEMAAEKCPDCCMFSSLRWFPLPHEVARLLTDTNTIKKK